MCSISRENNMKLVIRKKDYIFVENSQPDDRVLKTWNSEKESELLQKYVKETKVLCGNPLECRFPDYYFGNFRPWDYEQVIKHGKFNSEDLVLECGAFHSYLCIWLSKQVKHYTTGDSFYWATREYAQNPALQTPKEWCDYVMKKSDNLFAEECDLQTLKYPDNYFNKVINISVIEHVHNDRKGIEEMMRVLKPGGSLLLTTEYNPKHSKDYAEDDGSYYRVYDTKGVADLFQGFNVEVKKTEGNNDMETGRFTTLFVKVTKCV